VSREVKVNDESAEVRSALRRSMEAVDLGLSGSFAEKI
jgi:hypothetical protein